MFSFLLWTVCKRLRRRVFQWGGKFINNRETSSEDESCRIMTTAQRWWERRFEQFIITNRNIPLHSKWKIQKQSVQHFLPACLQAFLVSNDLKGHTITQAMRPRSVIAPIVFGLNWRWFLDQLNSFCFSISYDEVCSWSLWIKRRQFWSQQPSMNPAHFTGCVSSAD